MRLRPDLLLGLATFIVSLPLVAGFFGAHHPALDSFAHFRAHLAVATGLLGLLLLVTRLKREGLAALALGIAALTTTLGLGAIRPSGEDRADGRPAAQYRLMHLNLRFDNPEPGLTLSLIGRLSPDVITLAEVSAMWRDRLAPLERAYPHQVVCRRANPIGAVAILSRRPFAPDRAPACHGDGTLAIARIDFGGRGVDVAAIHLGWPWPFQQREEIDGLARHLGTLGPRALLAGDFNAVGWSNAVRRTGVVGGLSRIAGSGPTWLHHALPTAMRPFLGLPIDHILAKGGIRPISIVTPADAGSDHLPVLLTFGVEGSGSQPTIEQVQLVERD